jgi:hypothetical protein
MLQAYSFDHTSYANKKTKSTFPEENSTVTSSKDIAVFEAVEKVRFYPLTPFKNYSHLILVTAEKKIDFGLRSV